MGKILIACEESGRVRDAFRERGHNAWSCDILDCRSSEYKEYHIKGDVLEVLQDDWDMIIGFPPCTYLCNSGVRWLHERPERWQQMEEGAALFNAILGSCNRVAVENPVMHKYAKALIGEQSQSIQLYQFGHLETKRTCLWLRGLPELVPTSDLKEETMALPYKDRALVHYASPGPDRARFRSETRQGVADAMAEQWARLL